MQVPPHRVPVRLARGDFADLDDARQSGALREGELVYASDQDSLFVVESVAGSLRLIPVGGGGGGGGDGGPVVGPLPPGQTVALVVEGTTAPPNPRLGEMWVDISAGHPDLKIYDGTAWVASVEGDGQTVIENISGGAAGTMTRTLSVGTIDMGVLP